MVRWLIALSLLMAGCNPPLEVAPRPEMTHVVVVWLHEPGNADAIDRLMQATLELDKKIPGIERVSIGRALAPPASTRPVVDSTYDLLIIMTFDSPAALIAYENTQCTSGR